MRLHTLGGMALEGCAFSRPKPLLLLTFLAVEGRQPRRHVAELFWPSARDRMKALTVALARLRRGAPGAIEADADHVWSSVDIDAERFLAAAREARYDDALALYTGPFLAGFHPRFYGAEVEEWVYQTREHLAGHARQALLAVAETHAEQGRLADAAAQAESAYRLPGAAPADADALRHMHAVLRAAHSPTARQVADEARALGLDLDAPERVAPSRGSRAAGPPRANRLAQRAGSFVGRVPEREEVAALLREPDGRLVTLIGPPGVGKSRLAEQIALDQAERGDLTGGVALVKTGSIQTAAELPAALARALDLSTSRGTPALAAVCDALHARPMLLVLDDVERLVAEDERRFGDALATLLRRCPGLRLLVTSRTRLSLERERSYPLEGLAYPRSDGVGVAEARRSDAVRLFEHRAGRVRPGFVVTEDSLTSVLTICGLVDGSPLALVLAASWVRAMGVADIALELDRGLDLLVADHRDAAPRHASMRSALDASWRLLTQAQRATLGALSSLADGFDRAAALAVAGAGPPELAALVDASLLRSDVDGGYALHPLVRQDADERLRAHPTSYHRARARQRRHYVGLLCESEADLDGSERQAAAIARLEAALPNILLAWRSAAEEAAVGELWDACRPLQRLFAQRGGTDEAASEAFAFAHARLASDDPSQRALVGRLLAAEAWFRFLAGAMALARAAATRALDLLRAGEQPTEHPSEHPTEQPTEHPTEHPTVEPSGTSAGHATRARARAEISALNTLANVAQREGDLETAERHLEEGLQRTRGHGDEAQLTMLMNNLALLKKANGAFEEAEDLLVEALALNRVRSDQRSAARNLANLGSVLVVAGRPVDAEAHLEEGLRLSTELGYEALIPDLLANLGGAAFCRGDVALARDRYRASLERSEAAGDTTAIARSRSALARIEAARGDDAAANRHLAAALPLAHAVGDVRVVASCLLGLAERHLAAGEAGDAAVLGAAAEAVGALDPADALRLDALTDAIRSALPADVIRSARTRGAGLSIERIAVEVGRPTGRPGLRRPDAPGATRS